MRRSFAAKTFPREGLNQRSAKNSIPSCGEGCLLADGFGALDIARRRFATQPQARHHFCRDNSAPAINSEAIRRVFPLGRETGSRPQILGRYWVIARHSGLDGLTDRPNSRLGRFSGDLGRFGTITVAGHEQHGPPGGSILGGWLELCLVSSRGGGWGIRTPEGFHPTRFPSVRHRPLGESSGAMEDLGPPTL